MNKFDKAVISLVLSAYLVDELPNHLTAWFASFACGLVYLFWWGWEEWLKFKKEGKP